jgi:hypothetical protein
MLSYLESIFGVCRYRITPGGFLRHRDCHEEKIMSGEFCMNNPDVCYQMNGDRHPRNVMKTYGFLTF